MKKFGTKKWLALFAASMMTMVCFGQEHISFKYVEMRYDAQTYIQKLIQEGANLISTEKTKMQNVYTMRGDFATTDNCTIKIYTHRSDSIVGKAVVLFPKEENWQKTKDNYRYLREIYISKYGDYSAEYFSFSTPYREGDGREFEAFAKGRARYITYWKDLSIGLIKIEINKMGQIQITYEDRINWHEIQTSNRRDIEAEI